MKTFNERYKTILKNMEEHNFTEEEKQEVYEDLRLHDEDFTAWISKMCKDTKRNTKYLMIL